MAKKTGVAIVLPTYNESGNIRKHIDKILSLSMKFPEYSLNILVVDDNSPDGTSAIVRKHSSKKVNLLLREGKKGLGSAYVEGITNAIKKFKPDVVIGMDSDGQHNPKDIFRLIEEIEKGADMVIGSRFIEGGTIAKSWTLNQRIKSYFARNIAKLFMGIKGVKDVSGGFRATKTELLKNMKMDTFEVSGYAFQVVMLERALRLGARVVEIPIHFGDRHGGVSKMSISDMLEGGVICVRTMVKKIFLRD